MAASIPISCCDCTLLIKLLLELFVFVVHVLSETATMMLHFAWASLPNVQRLALVLRFDMPIPCRWVRHDVHNFRASLCAGDLKVDRGACMLSVLLGMTS